MVLEQNYFGGRAAANAIVLGGEREAWSLAIMCM